jgi:hypothetical protein
VAERDPAAVGSQDGMGSQAMLLDLVRLPPDIAEGVGAVADPHDHVCAQEKSNVLVAVSVLERLGSREDLIVVEVPHFVHDRESRALNAVPTWADLAPVAAHRPSGPVDTSWPGGYELGCHHGSPNETCASRMQLRTGSTCFTT